VTTPGGPATPTPPSYTAGWCRQDQAAIAPPSGLTVTPSATGGTLPDGPVFWVLTATNGSGETPASNEVTATLAGSPANSSSAVLNWPAVTGETDYKLYRGAAAGVENELVATIAAGTLTYTDTGAAGTAVSPPTKNTTGTQAVAIRTNIETSNNYKDWGVMTIDHGGHYATWDEVQNWADLH
jgi:hypothetical protein